MIINGLPGDLVNANDRGLLYGDGVFRTMLVCNGHIPHWQQHYNKLQHDCSAIALDCPPIKNLADELSQLTHSNPDGVAKIIITRGTGTRGYTPPVQYQATRILSISPSPSYPTSFSSSGVKVHICNTRLGHQPRLAGVKHLNRLENVLAAAEWSDAHYSEGLLLNEAGHVIEATRSNLFLVKNDNLLTPDLSRCGVAGLQRDRVIEWASQHGRECKIATLHMDNLLEADEVFLVNNVIGLWPVREMTGYKRNHFTVSLLIQDWLLNGAH
jgi:4-amino-4-deoxychorismate lyase